MERPLSFQAPVPLTAGHAIAGFDCGIPNLNDWLIKHALQAQGSGSARTFVTVGDGRVVGYYALSLGQVDVTQAPERIRKGMGRYPIPVIVLARLAVDSNAQGQGLGAGLLQDAVLRALTVAEHAGVRAILTHPINEAAGTFYRRFGFAPSPLDPGQLLILLKDARALVRPQG
jgi:GNAT superfamily N-acetyltransferase